MTGPHADVAQVLAWLRARFDASGRRGDLQLDSRNIAAGDVFVALPGVTPGADDGRCYLASARERGAVAALVEAEGFDGTDIHLPVLPVRGLRLLLGQLAARHYGLPAESLQVVGVTGTNGKTSTAHWIAQLLSQAGRRCAVLGTVGSGFPGDELAEAELTTPDPISLQREVLRLYQAGAQALAMEVSSIGLDQGRVNGMCFDVAVFTNLTRDHLDYHGTMAAYEAAKTQLFDWPTLTAAVLNLDDGAGRRLHERLADRSGAGALRLVGYTVGASQPANDGLALLLRATNLRTGAEGIAFMLQAGAHEIELSAPLVGSYNVANLLAAIGAAVCCGVDLEAACRHAARLVPPPGRMQRVGGEGEAPLVIVDYAHTADAIEQALRALRPQARARGGRLWIVFGAGGDRDPGKRAPMGAVAAQFADHLVITSDNPRREDPAAIIAAVAAGAFAASAIATIADRSQAIASAVAAAAPCDVVLIAGKGHETTQEIGGVKRPFSDVAQARMALAARTGVMC